MKFCEKCGSKLEPNAKFCEACGTKVEVVESPKVEKRERKPRQKVEMKPLTKKQQIIGVSILGLILFVFLGYQFGSSVYSQENQTDRIVEALSAKDAEQIADVVH